MSHAPPSSLPTRGPCGAVQRAGEVPVNAFHLNVAIKACRRHKDWQRALQLLRAAPKMMLGGAVVMWHYVAKYLEWILVVLVLVASCCCPCTGQPTSVLIHSVRCRDVLFQGKWSQIASLTMR